MKLLSAETSEKTKPTQDAGRLFGRKRLVQRIRASCKIVSPVCSTELPCALALSETDESRLLREACFTGDSLSESLQASSRESFTVHVGRYVEPWRRSAGYQGAGVWYRTCERRTPASTTLTVRGFQAIVECLMKFPLLPLEGNVSSARRKRSWPT